MKKVKITAIRKSEYKDLIEKYENPIEHACDINEGDVFVANGWERPEGLCLSAWESMSQFVLALSHGGENFYDGWMKNPRSAMISCNDGFRPVSFYLETLDRALRYSRLFGQAFLNEIQERTITDHYENKTANTFAYCIASTRCSFDVCSL